MFAAQHIDYEYVIETVPVDVGDIQPHRRKRNLSHGKRGKRAKVSFPIVEHRLSIFFAEGEPGIGLVSKRYRPIISHIKIERPIAIEVPQRQRHSATIWVQYRRRFSEVSPPVVQKNMRPSAQRIDN